HLDIEIHTRAEPRAIEQLDHGRERVDTEAAHAVRNIEGERVEPHEHVREIATVEAALRHRFIKHGPTANHLVRMRARLREEAPDIAERMLPIRIDLKRMREAPRARRAKAR